MHPAIEHCNLLAMGKVYLVSTTDLGILLEVSTLPFSPFLSFSLTLLDHKAANDRYTYRPHNNSGPIGHYTMQLMYILDGNLHY